MVQKCRKPPEYHKNMVPRRPAIEILRAPLWFPTFSASHTLCIQDNGFRWKMQVFFSVLYSFRMAASGLSFMALSAGKKPAAMPMNTAKASDAAASHNGIREMFPLIPVML